MKKNYFVEFATDKEAWEKLEKKRKEKGLTLTQLADIGGCSRQYLSQCRKREELPHGRYLYLILSELGIDRGWLFGSEASTFQHINEMLRELDSAKASRIRKEIEAIAEILINFEKM